MTKREVEKILKRYPFVTRAIKIGKPQAVFYIGNRKKVIDITDETKTVCELIEIVYNEEKDANIKFMIKELRLGANDTYIMERIHCSKNAYYSRKAAFIGKVFNLCISRNIVTFEEILTERIA